MRRFGALAAIAAIALSWQPVAAQQALPSAPADASREATWLELGQALAAAGASGTGAAPTTSTASPPASAPPEAQRYVAWERRVGPAYPGDFWTSFGRDGKEFVPVMLDDMKATVTNPVSLVALGLAAASGIALPSSGTDNHVERHFTKHGSQLNGFWDSVGDSGGNPGTHFAIAGAFYLTTLAMQDTPNYEKSKSLFSALTITGLVTTGLKAAAQTTSPNGDRWGWPSGHASSSFAFATVLQEEYGPVAGVPAFAFATFVGYERIDARNHDFSDVISGALIGMAIGHAVCQNHHARIGGVEVVPYVDGRGGVGVGLSKSW